MKHRIAIRVEGSSCIGMGHVARCLTLAEEFSRNEIESVFCLKDVDELFADEISRRGFRVSLIPADAQTQEDAAYFTSVFEKYNCQGAVLDGYDFHQDYLQRIRERIPFILSIDDLANNFLSSDIILNQNITATVRMYESKVLADAKLLLGPTYALLREEFKQLHDVPKDFSRVRNVLVTFGGGVDPHNVTLKVLKALERNREDFTITIVNGISNPHDRKIGEYEASSKGRIRAFKNVRNMGKLMAEADIAISSGGSTVWELCCLGVPALQIVFAENQTDVANELNRRGMTINLGWHADVTEEMICENLADLIDNYNQRRAMGCRGRALVDGWGAQRVVTKLLAFIREKSPL